MRAQFTPGKQSTRFAESADGFSSDSALTATGLDAPPPGPPPDTTILDEALFTAASNQPYSISSNSRRVSGYLKELESYLKEQPPTTAVPSSSGASAIQQSRPFQQAISAVDSDKSDEDSLDGQSGGINNSTLHSIANAFNSTVSSSTASGDEAKPPAVPSSSNGPTGRPVTTHHHEEGSDDDDDDDLMMDDFLFNLSKGSSV